MSYAVRKDGQGWRMVNSAEDVGADEVYADTPPAPILPDSAATIRAARIPLLQAADASVHKAEDNGQDAAPWRKYRQALRDVTKQKTFPRSVEWPPLPE